MMCGIVLPVLYFIPGSDNGSYENTLDSLVMLTHNGAFVCGCEVLGVDTGVASKLQVRRRRWDVAFSVPRSEWWLNDFY